MMSLSATYDENDCSYTRLSIEYAMFGSYAYYMNKGMLGLING